MLWIILRFIIEDDKLRKKVRTIRHDLDEIARDKAILIGIASRNSVADMGKETDALEFKRKTVIDTVYINLQRAKESLRVLEEFLKLTTPKKVALIKSLRYKVYTLEKTILLKWPPGK